MALWEMALREMALREMVLREMTLREMALREMALQEMTLQEMTLPACGHVFASLCGASCAWNPAAWREVSPKNGLPDVFWDV
jgi:hypothetical protein